MSGRAAASHVQGPGFDPLHQPINNERKLKVRHGSTRVFVSLALSRWRRENGKFQGQPTLHSKTMWRERGEGGGGRKGEREEGEKLTFRADPDSHFNKRSPTSL